MLSKRGTKQLHEKHPELSHIEIQKGCYGFYSRNINYNHQTGGIVRKSFIEVIADIESGNLPKQIID
jgi:hypothetical protein